ncbi:MAG: hypothetical protein OXH03_09470 [Bacteroidetes bacterium]|nr:hypothetical protein [Bacteroidota bacterium]
MQYKILYPLTVISICLIFGQRIAQAQPLVNEAKLVELGEVWLAYVEIERGTIRVAETAWWTTEAIRLNTEARRLEELEIALTTLDLELKKLANTKLGFFDYVIGIVADALDDADGVSNWSFVEEVNRFEFKRTATSAIRTQFESAWAGRLDNERIQLREELAVLKEKLGFYEEWSPDPLNEIPQEVFESVIADKISQAESIRINEAQRRVRTQTFEFQQKLQSDIIELRGKMSAEMNELLFTNDESTLPLEERELRDEIIALASVKADFPASGLLYDADRLVREAARKFAFVAEEEGLEVEELPTNAVLLSLARGTTLLARGAELLGYIERGLWTNPLPTLGDEWVGLAEIVEEQATRVEQIVGWIAEMEAMEVEQEVAMVLRVGHIANAARTAGIDDAGLVAKQAEIMQLLLEGRAKREEIEAERWEKLLEEASWLATEAKWLAIEGRRLVGREAFAEGVWPTEGRKNLDEQAGRLAVMASRIAEQVMRHMN